MPARLSASLSARVRPRVTARAIACLVVSAVVAASACAARQVEVSTGAEPVAAASLQFTNNLPQAVNVYLRSGTGSELFVRQVAGRSTETIPVRGVRDGASVQLRIAPVDGSQAYTRENVVVGQGTAVRVP